MEIDVTQLAKSLLKKGFVHDNGDHQFYRHQYKGKYTSVRTKISHGAKTYSNDLVSVVKRQMKFPSTGELRDFISCKLSADEYNEILIENGVFPR